MLSTGLFHTIEKNIVEKIYTEKSPTVFATSREKPYSIFETVVEELFRWYKGETCTREKHVLFKRYVSFLLFQNYYCFSIH